MLFRVFHVSIIFTLCFFGTRHPQLGTKVSGVCKSSSYCIQEYEEDRRRVVFYQHVKNDGVAIGSVSQM